MKEKYKSKKRRPCYHNTVCAKLFKKHFSKSISKRYQGNFMRTVGVLRALHAFLVKPPTVFYRFLRFSVKTVTVIGFLRLILRKTVTVIGSLMLILRKTVTVIGFLRLILRKTVTVICSQRLILRKTVTVINSLSLVQGRNRRLPVAKGFNRTEADYSSLTGKIDCPYAREEYTYFGVSCPCFQKEKQQPLLPPGIADQ